MSTWLNAGVPASQVAEWAGHSVDVLLRVYAKCISGQQAEAKRRIEEATRPREDQLRVTPRRLKLGHVLGTAGRI